MFQATSCQEWLNAFAAKLGRIRLINIELTEEKAVPVKLEERRDGKILVVHVTERLDKQDYEQFAPEVERLIKQHNSRRLMGSMGTERL